MKKPFWSKMKIGSWYVMTGLCLVFLQGIYGCPIILFDEPTGHMPAKSWGSQLNYPLFMKPGLNGSKLHADDASLAGLQYLALDGSRKDGNRKELKYLDGLDHPGMGLDFFKAFFFEIPRGKWTLADIRTRSFLSPGPAPEPTNMLILGSGLIGIALFGRKPNY